MVRGFYAAASGMVAQIARQDVYASNLANASTVGYRRTQTVSSTFANDLAATLDGSSSASGGTDAVGVPLDLTQGALVSTDRPQDLALNGQGFFTIQTPQGVAYTRDGRFMLDAQKRLVTVQGYPVLGEKGPLTLPNSNYTVTAEGRVLSGKTEVGRLRIVEPTGLRPIGGNAYTATATRAARGFTIAQGMVEQSNVTAMQEMGRMMNGLRLYEANSSALRYQDESLATLAKLID